MSPVAHRPPMTVQHCKWLAGVLAFAVFALILAGMAVAETTGSGATAGSAQSGDVPDRSNPNEMAAHEKAAARAGTVTDGRGNPVTSTNADGTKSVVTSGNATDFERSMAQHQFAAQTGNPLSRDAQDLAASVAQKETAATVN